MEDRDLDKYFGSKLPAKKYTKLPKHKSPSAKYSYIAEEMDKMDKNIEGIELLGGAGLTMQHMVDSMRALMFSSAREQAMTILFPEPPFIKTGMENVTGNYSTFHKRAKNDLKVVHRFVKNKYNSVYIIYDKCTGMYDAIERLEIVTRQENSGIQYKNDIDKYSENDTISKGEFLFRSTSYDDFDNFSYGRNANTLYIVSPETHEDAAVISQSFADKLTYINTYEIFVKLRRDELLLNLYGDMDSYKAFPDIGEFTKDSLVCTSRKVTDDNILSDCSSRKMFKGFNSDVKYYCENGEIIDVQVYMNTPRIDDSKSQNTYLSQVYSYLDDQNKFWENVHNAMRDIKDKVGDDKITSSFYDIYTKAKTFSNSSHVWAYKDSSINDLIIHFTLRKEAKIEIGQKITGRYGNKCVVSSIIQDEYMPHCENGDVIDVLFFGISPINRTIPFALLEPEITFTLKRIREYIATLELDKQEEVLWFVMDTLAKSDSDSLQKIYYSLSNEEKIEFMESVVKDGIYLNMTPFYQDKYEFLIDKLIKIRRKFPEVIKPYDVYIKKFGKRRLDGSMTSGIDCKMLRSVCVGQMYIFVLKQTGLKGFSARNAGSIDIQSLPQKSFAHTTRTSLYSNKPIRIGEYDLINMFIVIDDPIDYSLFTAMYRTSSEARSLIFDQIFSEDNLSDSEFMAKLPKTFSSTSVDIFNVYLKSLGREVIFLDEQYDVSTINTNSTHLVSFTDMDLQMEINEEDLLTLKILARAYSDINEPSPGILIDDDKLLEKIKQNIKPELYITLNPLMVQLSLKDRRFLKRKYTDYNTIIEK